LEIEAQAKRRIANEYDAAQAKGEVSKNGGNRGNQHVARIPDGNSAKAILGDGANKMLHDARKVRDAEDANPGVIREVLDRLLANDETTPIVRNYSTKNQPDRNAGTFSRAPTPL
jgi:hypothetical protein